MTVMTVVMTDDDDGNEGITLQRDAHNIGSESLPLTSIGCSTAHDDGNLKTTYVNFSHQTITFDLAVGYIHRQMNYLTLNALEL